MITPNIVCSGCLETLPHTAEHFPPDKAMARGLKKQCRACQRRAHKEWRSTAKGGEWQKRSLGNARRRYAENPDNRAKAAVRGARQRQEWREEMERNPAAREAQRLEWRIQGERKRRKAKERSNG